MNLNSIVTLIKNLSTAYPTVQEFAEGDIYTYLNSGEHKYPTVFLTVESISTNEDVQSINATIFYVDRLLEDSTNKLDIQTVSITALKSIIEKIQETNYINFTSIDYTPFTEKFADLCAGSFAKCVIEVNDELECADDYELSTLTIVEDGVYDTLGYSQVIVDVTKVRTLGGKSGDITLGEGLSIDDNNVLTGTASIELEQGENITITETENGYKLDVDDMRYDDTELREQISSLDEVTIPTIVNTTTNFTSGSKWTITSAFERCANLFGGIMADIKSSIKDLIPSQASSSNQLADKAFVNATIVTNTANFRGNWASWNDVPTDKNQYPVDYSGSKEPTNNDYLVVQDASGYAVENDGAWRFKYTGDWNTVGKLGWAPEYRIGSTFTEAQQAAIDSGITSEKVDKYDRYESKISANETNKVDKINTANKIYGTLSDGTQTGYELGDNLSFENGKINAAGTVYTPGDNINIEDNTISFDDNIIVPVRHYLQQQYIIDDTKNTYPITYIKNSSTNKVTILKGTKGTYNSNFGWIVSCYGGQKFILNIVGNKNNASNNILYAFTDDDDNYISGQLNSTTEDIILEDFEIIAPNNATKLYIQSIGTKSINAYVIYDENKSFEEANNNTVKFDNTVTFDEIKNALYNNKNITLIHKSVDPLIFRMDFAEKLGNSYGSKLCDYNFCNLEVIKDTNGKNHISYRFNLIDRQQYSVNLFITNENEWYYTCESLLPATHIIESTKKTYSVSDTSVFSTLSTQNLLNKKQDNLISGTNIKTINNKSLLGSGNIEIQGGGSNVEVVETPIRATEVEINNDVKGVNTTTGQQSVIFNSGDTISFKYVNTNENVATFYSDTSNRSYKFTNVRNGKFICKINYPDQSPQIFVIILENLYVDPDDYTFEQFIENYFYITNSEIKATGVNSTQKYFDINKKKNHKIRKPNNSQFVVLSKVPYKPMKENVYVFGKGLPIKVYVGDYDIDDLRGLIAETTDGRYGVEKIDYGFAYIIDYDFPDIEHYFLSVNNLGHSWNAFCITNVLDSIDTGKTIINEGWEFMSFCKTRAEFINEPTYSIMFDDIVKTTSPYFEIISGNIVNVDVPNIKVYNYGGNGWELQNIPKRYVIKCYRNIYKKYNNIRYNFRKLCGISLNNDDYSERAFFGYGANVLCIPKSSTYLYKGMDMMQNKWTHYPLKVYTIHKGKRSANSQTLRYNVIIRDQIVQNRPTVTIL